MKLKDYLDRNAESLDRVQEDLVAVRITQERHTASLEEHMRRTALAEESIEAIRAELTPIKNHVAAFGVVAKLAGGLGVLVGLLLGLKELLNF